MLCVKISQLKSLLQIGNGSYRIIDMAIIISYHKTKRAIQLKSRYSLHALYD